MSIHTSTDADRTDVRLSNHNQLTPGIPTLTDSVPSASNLKPPSNPLDIAHQKNRNPQLKRALWYTLILMLLAAVAYALLAMPSTKAWVDKHQVFPWFSNLVQHVHQTPLPPAIRVADQLDPARSAPLDSAVMNKETTQIASFFAKKYRLAQTEVDKYLQFAFTAANAKGLDPHLVMAVMSIESNLNPITESNMGAQGLMQVLTAVHLDKLAAYGGAHKVFDPEVNITVGVQILTDCIKLGGSIEMGLKCYVGATGPTDNGYGLKVLAEKERIEKAKLGVFDFAANNKVLVDLGLIAPSVEPLTAYGAPANNLQDKGQLLTSNTSVLSNALPTAVSVPPASSGLSAPQPLIPSSVTALPPITQQLPVIHSGSAHSASVIVKQERSDASTNK